MTKLKSKPRTFARFSELMSSACAIRKGNRAAYGVHPTTVEGPLRVGQSRVASLSQRCNPGNMSTSYPIALEMVLPAANCQLRSQEALLDRADQRDIAADTAQWRARNSC
ncbi:unnamed protein product [Peronospora belbahrii]|uniref:Uncharacterized protein n=1 Tax=Peronospora belbahrii TaxID=622444 RepID=A0AAU9KR26_9STRA|nr:unnamed protein product [Peronospora belbahrii]CAH0520339.1 unnamed protein product [Peronospora belbahrii]